MKFLLRSFVAFGLLCTIARDVRGQSAYSFTRWMNTPAVAGYEQELTKQIKDELKSFSPHTDNLGNVYVTVGSGSPHRVIVTPIDEPGYVVSAITPDGYIRVQRLPQQSPTPVFDQLHAAQPVWIMTRSGKKVVGVFAGLSIHLQPLRQNAPKMAHPDEMYLDIGAQSAAEVRAAGVDLLDPVALLRRHVTLNEDRVVAGPAAGDRFGCTLLIELVKRLSEAKASGTTTVAFVTQQWTGARGFDRILNELPADEMIYLGRLRTSITNSPATAESASTIRSGILLGVTDTSAPLSAFANELKMLADSKQFAFTPVVAAPLRPAGYTRLTPLPTRFAQLGVETHLPVTPGETVSLDDVEKLEQLLEAYLQIPKPQTGTGMAGDNFSSGHPSTLQALIETYGASGHEEAVREKVKALLPKWAKPETDAAGNLSLHLGDAKPDGKTPRILFVAHMDEIGFQVRSIEPDGRLLLEQLSGGFPEYYLGHVVFIHKSDGSTMGGVLELPAGWEKPSFEWPHGPRTMEDPAHAYVGTHSAEETQKLGIKAGDWITIPKEYRPLLGTRANGRSFDDRVGCTAQIAAVQALGPSLPGRDVTFIWSTREELGLLGAAAAAERLSKEGHAPDFVFAIDTFVSSDSPLESKRFADAEIGKGFVLRAIDNSSITPREYVDRVIKLAKENKIPVQFGVTGGGNDGSVFPRYGAVDIPLSWPLRYAHSPGEVIDIRDVDALSKIVTVLAKSW